MMYVLGIIWFLSLVSFVIGIFDSKNRINFCSLGLALWVLGAIFKVVLGL